MTLMTPMTPTQPDFRTLTPAQKKARVQAELASRVLAKRSLLHFTQRMNPNYKAGWVHADVCRRLEKFSLAVHEGRSPRLLLMMPPRAGKSELASKIFPAWHLGHYADHEFIACSYNVSLAMTFSRKAQALLEDPAYKTVFDTRLDPNHKSIEEWTLLGASGGFVAAGVGGGITGKGAHILSIDDPFKNSEDADNPDLREKLWDWYGSTAYTRLSPGGGVLVTQCMTADTPVLMADGSQRRIDQVRPGDEVATFDDGQLSSTVVEKQRSYGEDLIYKITMTSGRVVRANGRHPFLVSTAGELRWVRTRNLNTATTIVALPVNGVNGKEWSAPERAAPCPQGAEGCASPTTRKRNGLMGIARQAITRSLIAARTSSLATASLLKNSIACTMPRLGYAPSASYLQKRKPRLTGKANSASIIATLRARLEDFFATTATSLSGMQVAKPSRSQWPNTCDFTLDRVAAIECDGFEEVFDVQIARTRNFIANGLVTHNTCWHDDDLAGRIQAKMLKEPDFDRFEIIKYPAIAEAFEFVDSQTDEIVRVVEAADREAAFDSAVEHGHTALSLKHLRDKGDALHPERYDIKKLLQIKRTLTARHWSALYQQNPVPEDGQFFLAHQFQRRVFPQKERCNVNVAFDFAISTKTVNDYTVGSVGLQDETDHLHVVEMIRFRSSDVYFLVEQLLSLVARWYTPTLILGVEDGQIWRSMSAVLKKRMQEKRQHFVIKVLPPLTDKRARASVLQARMEQGMVSFNPVGEWYDIAKAELLRFDNGVHDDCVDSLGWMARLAQARQPPKPVGARPLKSWKDNLNAFVRGSEAGPMAA